MSLPDILHSLIPKTEITFEVETINIILTLKVGNLVVIHKDGPCFSDEQYTPWHLSRFLTQGYFPVQYTGPKFSKNVWRSCLKFWDLEIEALAIGVVREKDLWEVLKNKQIQQAFTEAVTIEILCEQPDNATKLCQILRLCGHCQNLNIQISRQRWQFSDYVPEAIPLPSVKSLKIIYWSSFIEYRDLQTQFYDSFEGLHLESLVLERAPLTPKSLQALCTPSLRHLEIVESSKKGLGVLGNVLYSEAPPLEYLRLGKLDLPENLHLPSFSESLELILEDFSPEDTLRLLRICCGNPRLICLRDLRMPDKFPRGPFLETFVKDCPHIKELVIDNCGWFSLQDYKQLCDLWAQYDKPKLETFTFDTTSNLQIGQLETLENPGGPLAKHVHAATLNSLHEIYSLHEIRGKNDSDSPPPSYSSVMEPNKKNGR